jgi:hypothetical protein
MGNRFYILDNGYLELDKNQMVAGATLGTADNKNVPSEWIQIPVYSVLIDNPERGWILYDTGCHPDGMKGRWSPSSLKVAPHFCSEDQLLVNQLKKLGLSPADIGTVVLSHMHCDHAGGLYLFRDTADVYVNKTDLMNALFLVYSTQDPNATGGTCKADVIEPVRKYHFLGDKDIEFAPGVELLFTPGHTAGLMALVVHGQAHWQDQPDPVQGFVRGPAAHQLPRARRRQGGPCGVQLRLQPALQHDPLRRQGGHRRQRKRAHERRKQVRRHLRV